MGRLEAVVRELQGKNESALLKDKKVMSFCLRQVAWPLLSRCKMNSCSLARVKEHMSGGGRNKSIQHHIASPLYRGS